MTVSPFTVNLETVASAGNSVPSLRTPAMVPRSFIDRSASADAANRVTWMRWLATNRGGIKASSGRPSISAARYPKMASAPLLNRRTRRWTSTEIMASSESSTMFAK